LTTEPFKRSKTAIIQSGIDPDMRRLFRLHGIRSSRERALKDAQAKYDKACMSVDFYWEEVEEAIEDQKAISEVH